MNINVALASLIPHQMQLQADMGGTLLDIRV
ncbi:hypothetical protein WP7W18E02_40380 [Aeromonas media]|nr:hypothetical protein WP7W18E02_40380 [Aeromonas media]